MDLLKSAENLVKSAAEEATKKAEEMAHSAVDDAKKEAEEKAKEAEKAAVTGAQAKADDLTKGTPLEGLSILGGGGEAGSGAGSGGGSGGGSEASGPPPGVKSGDTYRQKAPVVKKMEFPGVGKISLDTPDDDLKPFFRRKYRTMFRVYDNPGTKQIKSVDMQLVAAKIACHNPGDDLKETFNKQCEIYEKFVLFGKNSITEDEYVEEWMKIAFASAEDRKQKAEQIKDLVKSTFNVLDLDGDDKVTFEEFRTWYQLLGTGHATAECIFEAIDHNSSRTLGFIEYAYGYTSFCMCSGPESVFSLWFGHVVKA